MTTLGENVTEAEIEKQIREVDTDDDIQINYDEFVIRVWKPFE